MKKGSGFRFILLLLSVITVLGGCGQKEGVNTQTESANSEVKSELIYASAKDINDMNPHLYTGSMPAQGMVYESLVENTVDGIKPLLAESWDIAEDGKTYTFYLRQDVKFHDGEPFNAEAVKQNIDAVQANAEKHAWIKLSTKIVSTTVIDEYTFELVLSEPYYPALVELSMTRPYVFISPKDFKNGGTKDGVSGYDGTGPYKLTGHKIDESATFEANEEYWGGAPEIQKITSKVLPAGETTLLALQKGEINFVFTDDRGADSIDVEAMNQLADSGDYQVVRSEAMNTNMIVANSSKKDNPVHETAVREAIWVAIDRETISNDIFNGTQTVADTLFSSNVNYADVELKKREYSPETAKELLEKAGWTLSNTEAVRTKNGQQLAMTLYYDSNSSSQKTQAELIQHALKGLGIQLEIVGEESTSIANRRATGEYDLLFNQTWGLAYDPQSTISAFTSDSAYKHTTSGLAQADELYKKIDEVMVSTDEASRQSLYADIMRIVHDEAVFIPITNGRVTVVAPKNLDGISFKQTQYELPFEQMNFK
ncbi:MULTISPECIES: staphylopine-dependent metal ABC transporter substrate-binding lipoprotein [unclassified Paenibacillus]|uniref:staphylopine-dependent metal ABC transporter substrate-binding lipoprotein n=1 Tax=unclassified Paenibacillus TaxID=185978 RepID=UPI00040F9385|nr:MULTISPECIES: nickel ABC transporter substrate-binding protein [unclassified Paenibacillus]KGP79669.1 nickel ABC transporter substrate-binding protein [Paenibacillus sp. MAEPY2]KGP84101.1 nickel ABC transporter substrate-binding protein [Paenibacillus sp. MAEPY1]